MVLKIPSGELPITLYKQYQITFKVWNPRLGVQVSLKPLYCQIIVLDFAVICRARRSLLLVTLKLRRHF